MEKINIIQNLTSKLLDHLLLDIEDIKVIKEDDEKEIYYIKINTPESGRLIWFSWTNLENFSILLKSIIKNKLNENIKIHIEVNDYIERKDSKLFNFIDKQISILKQNWKEIILPKYNAYQRKKIHSYISWLNDSSITTRSVWEWEERRLHLIKISKTITIDIDSVWI